MSSTTTIEASEPEDPATSSTKEEKALDEWKESIKRTDPIHAFFFTHCNLSVGLAYFVSYGFRVMLVLGGYCAVFPLLKPVLPYHIPMYYLVLVGLIYPKRNIEWVHSIFTNITTKGQEKNTFSRWKKKFREMIKMGPSWDFIFGTIYWMTKLCLLTFCGINIVGKKGDLGPVASCYIVVNVYIVVESAGFTALFVPPVLLLFLFYDLAARLGWVDKHFVDPFHFLLVVKFHGKWTKGRGTRNWRVWDEDDWIMVDSNLSFSDSKKKWIKKDGNTTFHWIDDEWVKVVDEGNGGDL